MCCGLPCGPGELFASRHPNVVSFLGVVETQGVHVPEWVIMELPTCSLDKYLSHHKPWLRDLWRVLADALRVRAAW